MPSFDDTEARESAILAILQDIQAKEKYLPKEALGVRFGQKLHIPLEQDLSDCHVLPGLQPDAPGTARG